MWNEASDNAVSIFSNTYELKSQTAIRTPINLIALTLFWLIHHKVFNSLVQLKQVYLIFTRWHPLLWRSPLKNFNREQRIIETTNVFKMIDSQLIYRHVRLGNYKRKKNRLNNFLDAYKRILDIHAPCGNT